MEKLLFNINSTSWFHTFNGKVVKLEVFYLLMSAAAFLGAIGIGYEGSNGIDYGFFSLIMILPFLILVIQYLLYSELADEAPQEVISHFWKTELWRMRDPGFADYYKLWPDAKYRLEVLEKRWLETYGENTAYTISNAPWIQKGRIVILIGAAVLGLFIGIVV